MICDVQIMVIKLTYSVAGVQLKHIVGGWETSLKCGAKECQTIAHSRQSFYLFIVQCRQNVLFLMYYSSIDPVFKNIAFKARHLYLAHTLEL